jgi:hypothetical protein
VLALSSGAHNDAEIQGVATPAGMEILTHIANVTSQKSIRLQYALGMRLELSPAQPTMLRRFF